MSSFIQIFGNKFFQPFFKKLFQLSLKGMNYGSARDYKNNGELFALQIVRDMLMAKGDKTFVLMDVGANIGTYSQSLIMIFQDFNYELHIFEPSENTFKKLRQNLGRAERVHFHNIGLSSQKSAGVLFSSKGQSSLASLYPRNLKHTHIEFSQEEQVSLNTLDEFCSERNIREIDYLKIDVEGHELSVFEGARNMLTSNAIRIIQFEFGGCNIDSRTFFKDFYFLLSKNYKLFRIVKNGLVPLTSYSEDYEVFRSSNYLAIQI